MAATMATITANRICTRPIIWRAYSIGSDLSLEPCACSRERIARNLFVHVNCLRVLPQIVESRESARAVTLEWSFSGMFPMKGQQPVLVQIVGIMYLI